MKRAFVTGASGFVGANLVRRLLRDGHEVHVLLRDAKPWRLAEIADDLRVHVCDIRNKESLLAIMHDVRPEWIFHLAAYGAYSWQTDLPTMIQTNVSGTINMLKAGLTTGFEAMVNTGSSSEYGFKDHPPAEDELPEPNSNYAVTKLSGTLMCQAIAHAQTVCITTLRLYSVYGPYEEPRRFIPSLATRGLRGKLPQLACPEVARDYIHVDDVTEAFVAATTQRDKKGSIYNVGTGKQTSLREAVEVACRIMNIKAVPEWGSMPNRNLGHGCLGRGKWKNSARTWMAAAR